MIDLPSLYPHQEDLRDRTRSALSRHGRVILCAQTGMGKTRTAKWILGASANRDPGPNQSGRSLFTVHRRGLVDNAVDSFSENPAVPHGIIMSGRESNYGKRIQIASIDTMLSWFIEGGEYPSDVTFDLIVWDECVSGDAIVETDLGAMRLDEIPERRPSTVKSHSPERGTHFARILRWIPKGSHATVEVHTHAGNIRCTPDHEVYTRRGWLQAQFLSPTDEILACVDAAGDHERAGFTLGDTPGEPRGGSLSQSGESCTKTHRLALADVAGESRQNTATWMRGSETATSRDSTSSPMGMATAPATNRSSLHRSNAKPSSGHYSGIRRSATRIRTRSRPGFTALTDTSRRNGLSIRQRFSIDSTPRRALLRMTDGAASRYARRPLATLRSSGFTTPSSSGRRRKCRGNGSMQLVTLGLRGGFATTAPSGRRQCYSTLRDIPGERMNSSRSGFATASERPPSFAITERAATSSASPVGHKSRSERELRHMSRTACGTSWSRVTKIVPASPVAVYDIEVEGSHCFFANGLLVHNCHSHHPKFAKFLKYHDARRESLGQKPAYVIGLTATPQAKGLADIYKEIILGPSTQWLIDNHFLSPFRYFRATQGKLGLLVKRGDEFTKESESAAMEGLAGDLVRDWKKYAEGRPTVGFFPRRSHAQDAAVQLEAAGLRVAYVDGETPDEERRKAYRHLNEHFIDYLCNVQVVERGTDIPRIGCVQLCVAIGSVVRYRQCIGRGSRVHPEKTDCIVLDHGGNVLRHGFFEDDPQWSLDITTKDPGEHKTRPTIECPRCNAIYRGGKCRACGYEPTHSERRGQGLEFDGRELKEVKREEKKVAVKSAEELMVSALYIAGKSGRTWRQCCGIFNGLCKKQGSDFRIPSSVQVGGHRYRIVRAGSADGGRKVGDLYPFTVSRGEHGGEYLVRETVSQGAPY